MTTTDDTDTAGLPPAEERAFDQLMALLSLIANPARVERQLAELRRQSRETARAKCELAAEAGRIGDERRALDQRAKELDEREAALRRGEASLEARTEILSRPPDPYARMRRFHAGSDMAAEPDDEPSRASDPHFGQPPLAAPEDVVTERVPGPPGTTLHRSVPRRRPMRSSPDAA